MKQVDSSSLEFVAPALRLSGRTSGQTDFDDEHLQQVVDVSRLVPGQGIGDGFLDALIQIAHAASGTAFTSVDPYAITSIGTIDRLKSRVWVLGVQLQRPSPAAGDSIDSIRAGVRVAIGATASLNDWIIAATNRFGVNITSGGAEVGIDTHSDSAGDVLDMVKNYHVPVRLDPGSSLRAASVATIAVGPMSSQILYRLWIGPRGVNPPGVA